MTDWITGEKKEQTKQLRNKYQIDVLFLFWIPFNVNHSILFSQMLFALIFFKMVWRCVLHCCLFQIILFCCCWCCFLLLYDYYCFTLFNQDSNDLVSFSNIILGFFFLSVISNSSVVGLWHSITRHFNRWFDMIFSSN